MSLVRSPQEGIYGFVEFLRARLLNEMAGRQDNSMLYMPLRGHESSSCILPLVVAARFDEHRNARRYNSLRSLAQLG
jgi:hypothetical protein